MDKEVKQELRTSFYLTRKAEALLGALGVVIDAKVARKVRWRPFHGHWQHRDATRRVAPVEMLKEVIGLWNELVDTAEARFVKPMAEKAERWNIQAARSVTHLKKVMPELRERDSS